MLFFLCLWFLGGLKAPASVHTPDAEKTVPLKVVVKGVQKQKGNILIAVYDNEKDFEDNNTKHAVSKAKIPATHSSEVFDFQLKEGTYSLLIMQDFNNNQKIDKNWLGVPSEPVGVSNGFKSKVRKPTFAECSFTLRHPRQQIVIELVKF